MPQLGFPISATLSSCKEENFSFFDLRECILSGSDIVGNHTLYDVIHLDTNLIMVIKNENTNTINTKL